MRPDAQLLLCTDGYRYLPAAAHLRLQPHARPPAHVERADALGAVDLVRADGHEVDVVRVHIHGDLHNSALSFRTPQRCQRGRQNCTNSHCIVERPQSSAHLPQLDAMCRHCQDRHSTMQCTTLQASPKSMTHGRMPCRLPALRRCGRTPCARGTAPNLLHRLHHTCTSCISRCPWSALQ